MPEARNVASALAMIAGWAFSVRVSSSAGPSAISRGQLLAERLVHLLEHGAGLPARLGERLAHADRLAPLPRKDECAHRWCLLFRPGW